MRQSIRLFQGFWHARRPRSTIENSSLEGNRSCSVASRAVSALLAFGARLQAAVDLVTLPTRDGTQLTIYNSEDITMVREHRLLTVKEGVNRIQFSWANTLIDPTSIEFRILDKQDKVDLVDTTFPAGRNEPCNGTSRARSRARSPSRSGISLRASPGQPITWASPTRTRRSSA